MAGRFLEFSDYIVFVDESGSPTLSPMDPQYPIFVLVFCVFDKAIYCDQVQPSIKRLKFEFFGHDMAVLHGHEIRKPRGDFDFLLNPIKRAAFFERLNSILAAADFDIIAHVVDKKRLVERYRRPFDPYHIALRMNLEQLNCFLREKKQAAKLTHVIAESRGAKEDNELELEFRRIQDRDYDWGLAPSFPVEDTPFSLKFVEKKINSAGLQFADLVGQPIGRNYLKPDQSNRAFEILREKVYRRIGAFP